jgi:hypothetical protein
MSFQTTINDYQAPGVPGDFASLNPYSSVLAGNNALVAPAGGLTVGNFFWVGPAGQTSQSFVAGWQIAFLGRNMQALITQFLQEATMVVPQGFMVTGFNGGDFFANFPAGAAVGNYVFADPNDGTPVANATNTAPALGVATASAGFSGTANLVNASTTLTVATVVHGIVSPGDLVTDTTTGANIPAGTTIVAQLTGAAGGVGTYQMSQAAGGAGTGDTIATVSNQMLVTAVASGSLNPGDVFTGTAVPAGETILAQATPFKGVASIVTGSLSTLVVTSVQPLTDLLRLGAKLPAIPGLGIVAGTTISAQVSGTPGGVGSYTLSAAGTVGAGVPVTTQDSATGTGLYALSNAATFGALAVPETITVAGTAQATGFRVRGTYANPQGAAVAPTGVWKISAPVGNAT